MSWSRNEVTLLINEYRQWPNLYKVRSSQYKNKHARNTALLQIQTALAEIKPDVTINDIQSKFQGLKTNFFRERKKCLESQKSGQGTDDVYESTLWYYKDMYFLLDDSIPRQATDSADIQEDEHMTQGYEINDNSTYEVLPVAQNAISECDEVEVFDVILSPSPSHSYEPTLTPKTSSSQSYEHVPKKSKRKFVNADTVLENASGVLKEITSLYKTKNIKIDSKERNSTDVFGDFVASKLKEIKSSCIRNVTELEITKILYAAIKESDKEN